MEAPHIARPAGPTPGHPAKPHPEALDAPSVERLVARHFASHAARWGLRPDHVTARYVLNRGGFVAFNFTVTDGQRALHVKLAPDARHRAALRRWLRLHQPLETRYHAPPVLGWTRLPRTQLAGLVFPHLDGEAPDLGRAPDLRSALLDALGRLHADADLAARLRRGNGPPPRLRHTLLHTYVRRFQADLAIVRASPPDFVPPETLAWMADETRRMARLVRASPAFEPAATSPIHGDLWPNNLLASPGGAWYILDWDDLALGDPALDLSFLLGDAVEAEMEMEAVAAHLRPADPTLPERLRLYRRAALLDGVIDVLADYVEAAVAPEHTAWVRRDLRAAHLQALAAYRARYGSTTD